MGEFNIVLTQEAKENLEELARNPKERPRYRKVAKALDRLRENPHHPGLNSHKYKVWHGPNGEDVFESYVENNTPSAWRIWWFYGPPPNQITVLALDAHP